MAFPFRVSINSINEVTMQEVYLSVTRSGILGYFTGNFLVWNLTQEEYDKPSDWHIENCRRKGFLYVIR